MTGVRTVAIVGLGLIGGSLARALAARGVRVLGYDHDSSDLQAALDAGCVHAALGPTLEGVGEAEILILAVHVSAAPQVLAIAAPHLRGVRLVTDVGSTKYSIGAAAEALGIGDRFVGSHPFAGDHRSGWNASRARLFQGARVFLCAAASTRDETLALARALWTSLGADSVIMDADAHDRRLAWTSHLPQAASTALALALASAGVERADLGPGGHDTTRLAESSPEMWTGIMLDNAVALAAAILSLEERLGEVRAALATADEDAIRRFLAAGRRWSEEES